MSTNGGNWGEEYSVIGDKGEIGFIDFEDDKSVCGYNPFEEGPLIISVPFPFNESGRPQSVSVGKTAVDSITIKNTTDDAMEIWTKIYASTPEDSFKLSLMKPPTADSAENDGGRGFFESTKLEDRMVQPGETLTIWLSCKPKDLGLHTSVVHFDVDNDQIERVAFLLAEDNVSQSLSSNNPYARGKSARQFSVESYVRGSRPARATGKLSKRRLPRYEIPKDIRERLERKEIPNVFNEGLTCHNYSAYFKTLVIMEEIKLEEDMRAYDMENVNMRRRGGFLSLQVPGLAERRPSLVHGDYIFAKLASAATDVDSPFQGYIHRVESDEVHLKFAPEFHACHRDDNFYYVRFTYNRTNQRRLYKAIDAAEKLDLELLFPSESSGYRLIKTTPLVPKTCTLNDEQRRAIEMVLGLKGGTPYVIYGPPGTGKTMTLVETVLQLYSTQECARILLCAPSNSAADHILEKLLNEKDHQLEEREIFRLNATSRPYDDVNPDHIHFCFFDEQVFKCPPLGALGRYRIIISTYMSASLLFAEGVDRGYFSHIFLDEAGQASEPESMIPIASFCSPDTVVVLAGDPMQLGPVVYSRDAESYGLGKSYLERLCEFGNYAEGDVNYVTKLVRNYRCHPAILHLPSTLFYNGELIACKDESGSFLKSLKFLPNKDFPVFFFGIQGCDEREGNNPSWFNRIEISKVAEFVKSLIQTGSLSEEDIGIITPYRQQVMKLKKALENLKMPDIKVGSVEQFQGQEKEVIIVSTVRSTVKHNNFDKIHCLGFLSNPKRFNVAITRAISLLVIVGNPHIIVKDPYWSKLIWHSYDNNSYMGCALPERLEYDEFRVNEDNSSQSARVDEWVQDSVDTEAPRPVDEAEFSDGWN